MKNRPLYDALGVDPACSADELKQAWRDQMRELHPDRNPSDPNAAARFRSVRAAWEVLGDPKRRLLYDEFGEQSTSAWFDPDRVRSSGRTWSEDARAPTRKQYTTQRGEDYRTVLHLDREEARSGGLFELFVRAPAPCGYCKGTGWRPNQRACTRCESGRIPGIGPWGIPVPPGVVDGQVLVAKGEGQAGRGMGASPGDLLVVCQVPPVYRPSGRDQIVAVPVPHGLLLEGGKVRVVLPGGGAVRMVVPEASPPGMKLRIKGKAEGGGDLFVELTRLPAAVEVRARKMGLG